MVQYVYYEHITSHARKCTRFSEIYLLFDLIIDFKVMTEKKNRLQGCENTGDVVTKAR